MLKKEEMRRWLGDRLLMQSRLTTGALAGMVIMGLIATMMEFTLFYFIIKVGFISSGALAVLVTLGLLAMIQFATWLRLPKQLPDKIHEAELETGVIELKTAPDMTAVWTYAFGSLESERTWVEILLGLLSLPQRMCAAAWFTWQRLQELKAVEIAPCALVIRLLHKESERVELSKIIEEVPMDDVTAMLRQVSLIDGVVFLTRKSIGLSLANRLVDDLAEWKQKHSVEKTSA
jgi:hypothetical protein